MNAPYADTWEDEPKAPPSATPLLDAALRYADHGIHVFPLYVAIVEGEKKCKPISHWDDQSTTNPDRIRFWFGPTGQYRNASLAIDTGKSELVVVDPDGELGLANWANFCKLHNLGGTWIAHTPGGGQHWFYRADPERPVKNTRGTDIRGVAEKVDTRGAGGFIIAVPSRDDRGAYRWGAEGEPEWPELPVVPVAVVDAVNGKRVGRPSKPTGSDQNVLPFRSKDEIRQALADSGLDGFLSEEDIERATGAGGRRFTQDQAVEFCKPHMARLRAAKQGTRNDSLNIAAKSLSHFVPAFWSREQAEGFLYKALDPAYPRDEAERTIESAFRSAAGDWVAEKIEPSAQRAAGPDDPTATERALLPGLPDEFWDARPVLQHIRQAAWARVQVPDVVFYSLLARLSAVLDHNIKADSGIGRPACLNFYAAVVGSSGDGKTQGVRVANELIPDPHGLDFEGTLPLGSGEGIAEAYQDYVEEEGDNGRPRKVKRQVRHNVLMYVDEGQALIKLLFERNGATTGAALRTAWGGGLIGQKNATGETTRIVREGSYAFGLIVAMQPAVVDQLLADGGTGMPQRFAWSTAVDPNIPDERVPWPGDLPWDPRVIREGVTIRFADTIKDELFRASVARKRGEPDAQLADLDGQSPLMLVKLAALLALLDSRTDVTVEDWDLAHTVWDTSCKVRTALVQHSAEEKRRSEEVRSELYLERKVRETIAVTAVPRHIERIAKLVARWVHASTDGVSRDDMRKGRCASRDKKYLDSAIEHAVAQKWVRLDGGAYVPDRGLAAVDG